MLTQKSALSILHRFALWLICVCVVSFLLLGCGSKKYYTPKQAQDILIFDRSFSSPIATSNRYGATLKDGSLITQGGIIPYNAKIPKKSRFLGESGGYYIFAKGCESVYLVRTSVLDEQAFDNQTCSIKEQNVACTKDELEIKTTMCALSGSIKGSFLALIGNDNSMSIFDINAQTQEPKFSHKGSSVLAVNELIAAPLFLESLVVFPTLDGRLLVVSTKTFTPERNIIISSEKFFNNVIYLYGDDSRIFAATPKRLISIVSGQEFSYNESIKDALFYKGYLYVLTLDGMLAQLDHTLRPMNTEKFTYAKLEGIVIANDTLYTFETHGGYVIAVGLRDFSHKVYKTQDTFGRTPPNKLNFYSNSVFYYNQYYYDFGRLR